MKKVISVVLSVTAALVLSLSVCAVAEEKDGGTLKIGSANDISGDGALGNAYCVDAVKLLQDEINEQNGIVIGDTRYQIEFVFADSESKQEGAVSAIQKLVNQENCIAVMGPAASKNCLASYPIAQQAGCPAVAPAATNEAVTQIGDYIFRACFIDAYQGYAAASHMNDCGYKKVGVLYSNGDAYSTGLKDAFIDSFENTFGGEVVATESYSGADVKDFNVQLTMILGAEPEALFFPNNYAELPLQIQQVRQLGYEGLILAGDAADNPPTLQTAGLENLHDVRFVSAYAADSTEPRSKAFTDAYVEKYGREPIADAVLYYEAGTVIIEALKKCTDSLDRATLRDKIAETSDLEVPTGIMTMGEDRNPSKTAVIMTYDTDGERHFYAAVQ